MFLLCWLPRQPVYSAAAKWHTVLMEIKSLDSTTHTFLISSLETLLSGEGENQLKTLEMSSCIYFEGAGGSVIFTGFQISLQ